MHLPTTIPEEPAMNTARHSLLPGLLLMSWLLATSVWGGERTFQGGGAPWQGLGGGTAHKPLWTRPPVGDLPAGTALYEQTSFYVSESGTYTFRNVVDSYTEVPEPFPRAFYLYTYRFDSAEPTRDLLATVDASDGRDVTAEFMLLANNIYIIVLSTIGETQTPNADDVFPTVYSTFSGPGDILSNWCRFVDDYWFEDGSGNRWSYEAPMAFRNGAEELCVAAGWKDRDGEWHEARVAPQRTRDSVHFYFFNEDNWEIHAKLLNACKINNRFWFLVSASTDVEFWISLWWLGMDARPSPSSAAFRPWDPSNPVSQGYLIYRHDGDGPARSIVDTDSVLCSESE